MLAGIQDAGERLLTGTGYRQYEVSAYSRPGFRCRHNLNYWNFGDYLGIGAGAHGKITRSDNSILRYAKRRQPEDYMAAAPARFTAQRHQVDPADTAGEFMLNALRLNAGFTLPHFAARTGRDPAQFAAHLQRLQQRGLLDIAGERVRASALGRRFLDTLVAEFFPD